MREHCVKASGSKAVSSHVGGREHSSLRVVSEGQSAKLWADTSLMPLPRITVCSDRHSWNVPL